MTSETNDQKTALENESSPIGSQNTTQGTPIEVEDDEPKKFLRYAKSESVIRGIIFLVFGIFTLYFAFVLGMWASDEGWIPLFNIDLFRLNSLGFLIIIWTLAGIAAEVVKSVFGRYKMSFAVTSLVGNIIVLVTVCILFFQRNIMNPRFMERLGEAFEGGVPAFLEAILGNANIIVIVVVAIILIVETIKIWIKSIRYS